MIDTIIIEFQKRGIILHNNRRTYSIPAETRSYSEYLYRALDGRETDLPGLEEQNGRLQKLVGELLRKNQELHQEVAHLHSETH
jgi:hypothetical protein